MPRFLEKKLEKEYKSKPKEEREHAVYGTMNKLGLMRGSKETAKGKRVETKHEKKLSAKSKALRK